MKSEPVTWCGSDSNQIVTNQPEIKHWDVHKNTNQSVSFARAGTLVRKKKGLRKKKNQVIFTFKETSQKRLRELNAIREKL